MWAGGRGCPALCSGSCSPHKLSTTINICFICCICLNLRTRITVDESLLDMRNWARSVHQPNASLKKWEGRLARNYLKLINHVCCVIPAVDFFFLIESQTKPHIMVKEIYQRLSYFVSIQSNFGTKSAGKISVLSFPSSLPPTAKANWGFHSEISSYLTIFSFKFLNKPWGFLITNCCN